MKKFLSYLPLSAAAMVALSFAACSDSDVVADGSKTTGGSVNENAIMFSTYMGSSVQTRAGVTGSYDTDFLKGFPKDGTAWTKTNAQTQGFGVFAYYTGTQKYENQARTTGTAPTLFSNQSALAANFMFNQRVWWNNDATNDYVTKWTYSPIKYWPNEVKGTAVYHWTPASNPGITATGGATDPTTTTAGAINDYYHNTASDNWFQLTSITYDVDDQNNNTSNDPAQGGNANGGNVSFFAYAPYVELTSTALTSEQKENGIVAVNAQDNLDAANAVKTDPILTYKLPSAADKKAVDLLWGTAGINGTGVAGAQNQGVQGDGVDNDNSASYAESILDKYRMNADLTKQTTEGTINFLFKHALAKIGGSYTGTGVGDDEDGNTTTNGLMVILDIDDMKGAESGGSLEKYLSYGSLETGGKAEWNKYNTKVLINEIVIESSKQLKNEDKDKWKENINFNYSTMTEALKGQGDFNLATGQWSNLSGTVLYKQTIETSTKKPGEADYGKTTDDASKDAILSEEITEPNALPERNKAGFESLPIGVTTVAKNVYETETNPLVFIPGTMPVVEITITYTVRTYDPNLSTKYSEVKQRIKKNLYITEPVELNKQYNILMHLGLTSVKFTASVSDWDTTDATGTTTNPGEGKSPVTVYEEEMEHVYLPINVGEPKSVKATVGVPSGGDANLVSSAFTTGSQATDFAKVTKMEATFNGESEKEVELSHVTGYAVDKETGNMADWITYDQASNTFSVAANTSIKDREATLHIIYDNVADETYTVKQLGVKVQAAPELNIYKAGSAVTVTSNVTEAQPSAATKYTTKLIYSYKNVDKDDAEVGDAVTGQEATTGYTLTVGSNTTVNGTTITTKQYTAESYNPDATRTEATGVTAEYDGKTSAEVKFMQNAPVVSNVSLTIGGSTSQTVAASATISGAIVVKATFKDSDNKFAGEATVNNSVLLNAAGAGAWAITEETSWTSYTAGTNNITLDVNGSGSTRTATITANYNDGAVKGTATIKQQP